MSNAIINLHKPYSNYNKILFTIYYNILNVKLIFFDNFINEDFLLKRQICMPKFISHIQLMNVFSIVGAIALSNLFYGSALLQVREWFDNCKRNACFNLITFGFLINIQWYKIFPVYPCWEGDKFW